MVYKKIISFIFLIFSFNLIFPKDFHQNKSDDSGFVEVFVAMSKGKMGEYIFSSVDKNLMVSSLDWHYSPMIEEGIKIFKRWNSFQIEGVASFLNPSKVGSMFDLDYNSSFAKNRCVLENYLNSGVNFFLEMSYKIWDKDFFSFAPILSASYDYASFRSRNGYGWYGGSSFTNLDYDVPWNSEEAKYAKRVSGIDYERITGSVYLGGLCSIKQKKWNLDFTFLISPFSVIYSHDYHLDESNKGNDYNLIYRQFAWFKYLKSKIDFDILLSDNLSLAFGVEGLIGFMTKGLMLTDLYSGDGYGIFADESQYSLSAQASGSDLYNIEVSFGFRYNF